MAILITYFKGGIPIFKKELLRLIHCKSLNRKSILKLIDYNHDLSKIPSLTIAQFQMILQIDHKQALTIYTELRQIQIETLMDLYATRQISTVTIFDAEYPELLTQIYDPPLLLFAMGDISLLQRRALAVVGARDADHYAEAALDRLIPKLVEEKLVIVSGLAKGVDTMAHLKTIQLGGDTIAVIAGGFFHLYPAENRKLATFIQQQHLLISEYPPVWKPAKWHFPMRNRIISGLAEGTLIVQAKKRSGSLITADRALEEGREVFAVPGPIHHPLAEGSNHLIQQGAKLVQHPDDILVELR